MLGRWLRGPDAETITLETIGMIKGAKELDPSKDNMTGNVSAEVFAKKIDKVLRREGRVLDKQVRDLLIQTRDGLRELTKTEASFDTGKFVPVYPGVIMPIHKPNPEWKAQLQDLKSSLNEQADSIFNQTFASDVVAEHGGKPTAEVERAAKRDLSVGIAMKMGQL